MRHVPLVLGLPSVGHQDLYKGPNLLSCSAGCKSNTGDAENQSTGKGWEPGQPPLHRAQLNPLLVPPSQQLHPRGLLLPRSPAAAAPLVNRGTQR